MLDITVLQKETHTDRYLQFESHHPQHVQRGVVRSLYDRAQTVTLKEENLCDEKRYLELYRRMVIQDNS